MNASKKVKDYSASEGWFKFIIIFLIVEYGRPQDILPIGFLKPGFITITILSLYLLSTKGVGWSNSQQTKIIWYMVILISLYIPFAVNTYFAYHAFYNMISYMPFILSVAYCVNSNRRFRVLLNVLIALMIYVSGYSLTHGGMGSGNYFQDENDVSLYINMWLPFCFFLFMYEKNKKMKFFYLLGLIIGLAAIVVSFSRGGFVGLLCIMFVIWYFSSKKILTLFLIVLLGGATYLVSGDAYKKEMSTVTDTKESTADARIKMWESGWDMFLDNPFGVGGGNFPIRFPEYQGDRFDRGMWGRAAHSLWFTLFPELGIVGAFLFFRLIYVNVKDVFSVRKILSKYDNHASNLNYEKGFYKALVPAYLASFAGYFASGTFLSVLYYPHFWYMSALVVPFVLLSKASVDH